MAAEYHDSCFYILQCAFRNALRREEGGRREGNRMVDVPMN